MRNIFFRRKKPSAFEKLLKRVEVNEALKNKRCLREKMYQQLPEKPRNAGFIPIL